MLQSALDYDRFRNELTLALIQGWRFIDIWTGAQLGNFERGRRYIYNRKDDIIHGLSLTVKCVSI